MAFVSFVCLHKATLLEYLDDCADLGRALLATRKPCLILYDWVQGSAALSAAIWRVIHQRAQEREEQAALDRDLEYFWRYPTWDWEHF